MDGWGEAMRCEAMRSESMNGHWDSDSLACCWLFGHWSLMGCDVFVGVDCTVYTEFDV